jgi:H+/Cl- antiporter ClcA
MATAGGAAVGALAVAASAGSALGPEAVLFSGQDYIGTLVTDGPGLGVAALLALVVAKALAYAVSLGCGFRGGAIFPALTLGVAAGVVASLVLPGAAFTPAIVAGMAAATTATLRLPVASLVLAIVVAGGAGLEAAPMAIAAVVVTLVVGRLLDRKAEAPEEERPEEAVPST